MPDHEETGRNKKEIIRKFEDSGPENPPSKMDLLEDFLKQVNSPVVVPSYGLADFNDLRSVGWAEYAEPEFPDNLERKIAELKQIADSIERRQPGYDDTPEKDLGKYKVNYLSALNPSQLAAVLITEKPVLVIAGAGSGKTRVIVHRVSYLIEKGIDPQSILLLTFTRKASKEMLGRVEILLQDKRVGNVTGGTFHSFAAFILRKYANMINLPGNFTIIDASDSEDIIDLIRSELKFNTGDKKFPRKERINDIISYSRNRNTTISAVVHEQYTGLIGYIPDIELIFNTPANQCKG